MYSILVDSSAPEANRLELLLGMTYHNPPVHTDFASLCSTSPTIVDLKGVVVLVRLKMPVSFPMDPSNLEGSTIGLLIDARRTTEATDEPGLLWSMHNLQVVI